MHTHGDGRWMYFTKGDGRDGLWRMPIAGGEENRVIENLYRFNYAVTSNGVYFVPLPNPGGTSSVQFLDFTTGAISRLVSIDRPIDLGLAVSPDEKELLFTQSDYAGRDLMLVENFQ